MSGVADLDEGITNEKSDGRIISSRQLPAFEVQ